MKTENVRWSCSAQLDLLGFSNHLQVANWDIRTQTGRQAIDRLSSVEKAIELLEQEKAKHPQIYPDGLQYIRFNDALFLGIDVEHLMPPSGQTALTGGYSMVQLRKLHPQKDQTAFEGTTAESGADVAKFLGIVARMHKYINARETEKHFPGCRTVVASGLRQCFRDRKGVDDFFSANFSVSTAFEAEKRGSSAGLKGNRLYVEDDVAVAISYCKPSNAILGFSKFHRVDAPLVNPYQHEREGSSSISLGSWIRSKPIILDVAKKSLSFRCLNPTVLTNLQLFDDYQRISIEDGQIESDIHNALTDSTPSLEEVNAAQLPLKTSAHYPFLFLEFSLEEDYSAFFRQE